MLYQTSNFYLIRKISGLPSTWGQQFSLLDAIADFLQNGTCLAPYDKLFQKNPEFIKTCQGRGPQQEYGLLNRLDNATFGFVYFAKTHEDRNLYHHLQSHHYIKKYYIADVYGKIPGSFGRISTPIAHHPTNATKMITVTSKDISYRSTPQACSTYREKLYYDDILHRTTLQLTITKGVRHQIRCHCASIGYPLVNDPLYTTKNHRKSLRKLGLFDGNDALALMSIGLAYDIPSPLSTKSGL